MDNFKDSVHAQKDAIQKRLIKSLSRQRLKIYFSYIVTLLTDLDSLDYRTHIHSSNSIQSNVIALVSN